MPPEPRLHSERARRTAIAFLMALVLAASTAGAVWLSHVRAPGKIGEFEPQSFNWFAFASPDDWVAQTTGDAHLLGEPGLAPLATYFDRGPMSHVLSVYQYTSITPVGPEAALAEITAQLGFVIGQPQWFRGSPIFQGAAGARGSQGMIGLSDELLVVSRGGAVAHQAMTMLTLDGTRHVVLTLTGPVQQAQRTRDLLRDITATVRDLRYELVSPPLLFAARQIEQFPPQLSIYRASGQSGSAPLLAIPTAAPAFVAVRVMPVRLDEGVRTMADLLPGSDQAANVTLIPDRLADLLNDSRLDATDRMDLALVWRYWLVRGEPPPVGAIADPVFAGHPVRALAISRRGSPTYRLAWVLGLDEETGVLLEATASDQAAWPARQTAQHVAQMLVAP